MTPADIMAKILEELRPGVVDPDESVGDMIARMPADNQVHVLVATVCRCSACSAVFPVIDVTWAFYEDAPMAAECPHCESTEVHTIEGEMVGHG